ncbi:MAG: hypothetical protein A2687_04895 [Candidatus Levybacteria bacterium RIFCSPHIGHO2_01_FULL_38_26]|nr:MAG: hypothetical protein A2687_04895 [Candidatus Levybacteria bacterium RIFCSPHIGHO2_01_FULL_38_26]
MIWRFRFVFFILAFVYAVIIARLFYWQIVKAEDLSDIASSQYSQEIKLLPKRGEIKTSDGFPFVSNNVSYLLYANPKVIENKDKVIDNLSIYLGSDTASLSALLSLDRFWVSLESDIDLGTKKEIEKLELGGIGFEEQFSRIYPEASMAAHLLGFVGKDTLGQDKGYFGLEGYYDRLLRGEEKSIIEIQDALGRPILSRMTEILKGTDGNNLVLSIDRTIQYIVEKKLKYSIERYGATSGMVGIMDPKTGGMIALASFPSFSPSQYQDFEEDVFKNPFISNAYEPGSTFKPLIMAAALDASLVTPQTKCDICGGPLSVGGFTLRTWNNEYFENIDMIDVIRRSDNTGMVFVAQKLGLERMLSYIKKFGIGEPTGIDLQGEVAPTLKSKQEWYAADLATAGFGQGISLTPIELLDAFSSIANKGRRMKPYVVAGVEKENGKTVKIAPEELGRPISEKTALVMTEILVNAVEKGEAQWARLKGYRIAGKTGTSSIPVAGHYDPDQTIASFIGFAPADDPKFSMLVILDKPTTSPYGSETAAPLFFDIARDILNYYSIPPSE